MRNMVAITPRVPHIHRRSELHTAMKWSNGSVLARMGAPALLDSKQRTGSGHQQNMACSCPPPPPASAHAWHANRCSGLAGCMPRVPGAPGLARWAGCERCSPGAQGAVLHGTAYNTTGICVGLPSCCGACNVADASPCSSLLRSGCNGSRMGLSPPSDGNNRARAVAA
jgi:hypothetical protein